MFLPGGAALFPTGTGPGGTDPISGLEQYSVVIPAGTQTTTVLIYARNDNDISTGLSTWDSMKAGSTTPGDAGVVEGMELILTELLPAGASSNPSYTNSSSAFQEITKIVETDSARLTVTSHVLNEGQSANAVVTLHTDIEGELNVAFNTVDSATGSKRPSGGPSANQPGDYTNNSGLFPAFVNTMAGSVSSGLPFGAGFSLGTPWSVNAVDDTVGEVTEYYDLTVTASHNNGGATNTSDVGLVTIRDNDVIQVSANKMSVVEGKTGDTQKITFTVTMDTMNHTVPSGNLKIQTADDSATTTGSLASGKDDYVKIDPAVMVPFDGTKFTSTPIGSLSTDGKTLTFDVTVKGDDVIEWDQVFKVNFDYDTPLAGPVPVATVSKAITIEDDDTASIRLSSVANGVAVATDGSTTINGVSEASGAADVDIKLDKAIEGTLQVWAKTSDGTATKDLATPSWNRQRLCRRR